MAERPTGSPERTSALAPDPDLRHEHLRARSERLDFPERVATAESLSPRSRMAAEFGERIRSYLSISTTPPARNNLKSFQERLELAVKLSNGRVLEEPRLLICRECSQPSSFPVRIPRLPVEVLGAHMQVIRRAESFKLSARGSHTAEVPLREARIVRRGEKRRCAGEAAVEAASASVRGRRFPRVENLLRRNRGVVFPRRCGRASIERPCSKRVRSSSREVCWKCWK